MDYKPNSNRFKEQQKEASTTEKKKIEKVTTGKVKVKKKTGLQKMAGAMFAEDAEKVKSYILMDVLLPTIADGITDVLKKSIDAIFGRKSSSRDSRSSKVSYRSYYDNPDSRGTSTKARSVYDYDDIIFDSRGEAEEVLDRMDELVELYGNVSVAEFYDLAGISSEYTSNKYGWTNIHTAKIVRVSGDGYMIKLPRVMPL
jgi:hypothetical protein